MSALDLASLRVFVTVCEKGSMTEAARVLRITQAAVSQQVKQLERSLGLELVDRSLRPLRPTAAGAVLFQRGVRLLDEAEQAVIMTQYRGTASVPELRVGVIFSLSGPFVNSLALLFARRRRQPKLTIWTGMDLDHGRALLSRELDMIVTADALEDFDHFERHPLLTEQFILVLPPDVRDRPVDIERLARERPLIRYSARSLIGLQIERHLRRLRLRVPRSFEFDTSDTVLTMVQEGQGWAISTPLGLLQSGCDTERLRPLPFPGPGFSRRFTLVAREGEFGRLARELAGIGHDILREHYLPRLAALADWMRDSVAVGEGGVGSSDLARRARRIRP